MAKISTYELDTLISGDDKVIGTDSNGNPTKNFKISDLSNYIINQITPFEGYLDVVTPDSYVGTRLTPKTGYKSGFWIDHNSNSSVGFGAKNTNTGNGAVASIGVNSKIGIYESGISIFSASENYYKTEFRNKGMLYSPNDLGFYTINNNDFIWYTSTGDYYDVVNERMSLSNNGYLKLNSYGSGSVTGTEAYKLAVTSDGNIIEVDDTEGLAYLTPQLITASAGASGAIDPNYNLVLLSWTLGNGVYTLNLPLASANENRLIRITTDGTLANGSGDKIDITATGGETIDGDATFQISKRYEGLAVYSTGAEWIIVQAKAH
jgi:hypothetical protein